jgi:hypothetical protein
MAHDEPDNLVLRELRKLRSQMDERLAAIEARLDSMESNGMKMWRSFIGNRALTERGVASLAEDYDRLKVDVVDLQGRVRKLEAAHP